jgi:DNA-binding YbaB/EbfC family protein
MNIQKMMKQAQKMQSQMQEAQAALAEKSVEATVGGGKVTVTATGAGEITGIKIDPIVVDPEDVEMLEDLVLSGIHQACEKAKELASDEMGKVTGGMGLPPGMGF